MAIILPLGRFGLCMTQPADPHHSDPQGVFPAPSAGTEYESDIPSRILIVDDDPMLLEALREMIRARMTGVAVDTAASAEVALAAIQRSDYDAIVSDIKMPDMNGLVLLKRIRDVLPATPTLLITGHGEHDLAVLALRGGAFDFLQKPIDRDYFMASLGRAIKVRKLSRQVEAHKAALARHATDLERLVQERTVELERASQAKDEFLATLSHELRTPLTAIFGWAQMLQRENLEPAVFQRALQSIERNARVQAQLIDDLLDISRIITGKLRLHVRPLELVAIIEATIDAVQPAAEAKSIHLIRRFDSNAGLVSGDPDRLRQVIWNLLSNAIKFTSTGGRVTVTLARVDSSVEIRVTDTGDGIDPAFIPYVFDRFRQADSSATRKYGGLGLGLAIVRHLVEMHGGTAKVHSDGIGKGTSLAVRFPLIGTAVIASVSAGVAQPR
jgi:signal transduction histidine kinase